KRSATSTQGRCPRSRPRSRCGTRKPARKPSVARLCCHGSPGKSCSGNPARAPTCSRSAVRASPPQSLTSSRSRLRKNSRASGNDDEGTVVTGTVRLTDRLPAGFDPGMGDEGSGPHTGTPGGPDTPDATEQRGGQGPLQAVSTAAEHADGQDRMQGLFG